MYNIYVYIIYKIFVYKFYTNTFVYTERTKTYGLATEAVYVIHAENR